MNGKIKKVVAAVGCISFVIVGGSLCSFAASAQKKVINEGIYIGTLDVGGMTVKDAKNQLAEYVKNAKGENVTVKIDDEEVMTTLEELGYTCDVDYFVQEAYNYGKTGDVIKRYKEQMDLEQDDVVFDLAFELDTEKVTEFVEKECTVYDVEAQNAKLVRKNGKFKIKEATDGRVIVADETVEKIEKTIASQWVDGGITIEAIMNYTTPEYDSSSLGECQDVLGTYNTSFASSDSARSQNLVNAASLLNGYTIYPGEQFSVGDHLVPFTQENGYEVSKAYSNGQVVDSVGGGVCQAATTLYNALLKAELQIDERYNHSMIVGYVQPSMDAAISEGYKDLKFTNNSDTPIYLEAYTANRSIYFTLYGKEERDTTNRTVEYVSKVIETIQPGEDKVTIDESLPEDYFAVTQQAHVGYKAELWKIVYENGKEVSREQVNSSYYAAEPRYVTKGGQSEEKATKEPEKKENQEKTKATKVPAQTVTKAPSATKAPTVTAAPEVTKAPEVTQVPEEQANSEAEE